MKQTREKLRELDKETPIDNLLLFQGRISDLAPQFSDVNDYAEAKGAFVSIECRHCDRFSFQ